MSPLNWSEVEWGLKGLSEILNVHPLFVHFPIALLLSAALFYLLNISFKKEEFALIGKWVLYLGTVSAALTVWTGLRAAATVPHGGGGHQIMMAHQYLGMVILAVSFTLSLWLILSKTNIPSKGRSFFIGSLLVLAALIVQQADFGGRMVFLQGIGVGSKSMLMESEGHGHKDGHSHGGESSSTSSSHGDEHGHGHNGHSH